MALRISYCPYRLRFIHPFGTAHGVREGTDSLFIRLEEHGAVGYGEVTLPPYLKEKPAEVVQRLEALGRSGLADSDALRAVLDDPDAFGSGQQGCRAGLHMAWIDLVGYQQQLPIYQLLDIHLSKSVVALVTIGITEPRDVADKLLELPAFNALKIKIKDRSSMAMLEAVRRLDGRQLFLDANQGLDDVDEALALVAAADNRLLALQQPFAVDRADHQRDLQARIPVCIYGDESIQGPEDLERAPGVFGGVNIKLMKCG
ncbi:MAG: hypothetical protein JST66_16230, partial [Bacteroidetes bacterium]|nr:hypothetical protein [Bacteroidota bacterium]